MYQNDVLRGFAGDRFHREEMWLLRLGVVIELVLRHGLLQLDLFFYV